MPHLDLVKLTALMERTSGRPEIAIGLIDGPVAMAHPDLRREAIHEIPADQSSSCSLANSRACQHGTFVAGILTARRGSVAPAICPNCTLLVRPIFPETSSQDTLVPHANARDLATAIMDSIAAGAKVINLSAALAKPSTGCQQELGEALDYAARRAVIVIAAAGNQGMMGSSCITGHPWVVPVVAYDQHRRPMNQSNIGKSIGRRGLGAPGDQVSSLGSNGGPARSGGTSVAAPFVTGAVALLWSEFPFATAVEVKLALIQPTAVPRKTVVPPLLDAAAAFKALRELYQ